MGDMVALQYSQILLLLAITQVIERYFNLTYVYEYLNSIIFHYVNN